MTRARLGLLVALTAALCVAALSVGCWHATHRDPHRMLRLPLPGPAATAAGAGVGPSGTLSARIRRTPINVDPGYVHAAVPHRPPSREHPRGTLVLAGWKELFEIDIETGSLVRRTQNPADDKYFSLVRTTSGMALAWDALDRRIAFLDHDLRVQAVRALGHRSAVGMAADGDDLVVASHVGGTPEETCELVRMDASRATRIASVRQPGRVRWMLEYPAQVVVHRNRIHLLVYKPRIEVRSFDMGLTPSSVTSVEAQMEMFVS
ncbi:MAG: hypothetical protein L6Q84_07445 [Polyangiaceae bacterium]|nr:hypothetical protein [Polyangiaceae bacterium]